MPWRKGAARPVRTGRVPGAFLGVKTGGEFVECRVTDWPTLVRGRPELATWSQVRMSRRRMIAFGPPPERLLRLIAAAMRPGGPRN